MLDLLRDLFMDTLNEYPWWRRTLLIAILAAFFYWGSVTWPGIAMWATIFLLYEAAGFIFPPKPRK